MQHSMAGAFEPSITYLCTPRGQLSTSAHFGIRMGDGHIVQMVDTDDTAWHAMSCNPGWVGIEHDDEGDHADPVRTDVLYAASARLNKWLAVTHRYGISPETIRPHRSCVATACPSGLDVGRIIKESGGGMAYVDQAQFDAWRVALQKQLETSLVQRWEGDRITAGLSAAAGGPRTAARKSAPKLVIPELPKQVIKKATRAQVRAGHGRTK